MISYLRTFNSVFACTIISKGYMMHRAKIIENY